MTDRAPIAITALALGFLLASTPVIAIAPTPGPGEGRPAADPRTGDDRNSDAEQENARSSRSRAEEGAHREPKREARERCGDGSTETKGAPQVAIPEREDHTGPG